MSKNEDWIDDRLSQAKQSQPLVTAEVDVRMRNLLNNQLSERALSATEFAETAKELIAKMNVPPQPESEAFHED